MNKNLMIFGAGASYGAGHAVFGWNGNAFDKIPALGNGLFSDLQEFDPDGWGRLGDNFSSEFKADFEKGMQSLAEFYPHEMSRLQCAMAKYFFNFHPGSSNLYVRLAEKIKKSQWNGVIATLNYERLLEMSLRHVGLQPVFGRSTNEVGEIEICFPHGCCHFFCASVTGIASRISFSGPNVKTNGPIITVPDQNVFFNRIENDAFPPVMCYFDPKKDITSGKNFIDEQKKRLKELINEADNIAVIGIRVRPNDQHIWDFIEKTSARIIYCAGESGGQEYDSWKTNKRATNNRDVVLYGYFSDEFEKICNYLGL